MSFKGAPTLRCKKPATVPNDPWNFLKIGAVSATEAASHCTESQTAMVSTPDKTVPVLPAPAIVPALKSLAASAVPGLGTQAIEGLAASYPGILTTEMRSLLRITCGYTAGEFGPIDFTGRWHPAEALSVFRPSLTLAIDDEGRRWIAETSRPTGLPGPVWCLFTEPEVAIYVSDDVAGFLTKLSQSSRGGRTSEWLRQLQHIARDVWANRKRLAERSQESCRLDRTLRSWLAALPWGAQVYDLRTPSAVRGWPYGLVGPEGQLHRCARLPVFAVSACPTGRRWLEHLSHIAATHEIPRPAAARALPAAGSN